MSKRELEGSAEEKAINTVMEQTLLRDANKVIVPQYFDSDLGNFVPITKSWGNSGGGVGGGEVEFKQAVLPTTVVNQESWEIPWSDFDKNKDLLIVSHNTVIIPLSYYNIIEDSGSLFINYPNESQYERKIDNNLMFVIMIKSK